MATGRRKSRKKIYNSKLVVHNLEFICGHWLKVCVADKVGRRGKSFLDVEVDSEFGGGFY